MRSSLHLVSDLTPLLVYLSGLRPLLVPEQGFVVVDGMPITAANRRAWQDTIGYVPQGIYVTDDTIVRNIAFGFEDKQIEMALVEHAARIANLHEFIVNKLPDKYQIGVQECGLRLSGGQRQRIGVARALYRDPAVLVFDEATSALDGITEDAVLNAIKTLSQWKTIIMVAHRLTTLRDCDVIYLMEAGRIVQSGSYEDLLATNAQFRKMAKVAK